MSGSAIAAVQWAQRKKVVHVSFGVSGATGVNVTLDGKCLSFSCQGSSGQQFATSLELFGDVLPLRGNRYGVLQKGIRVVLEKKEPGDWERLTSTPAKEVKAFVSYDWDLDGSLPDDEPSEDDYAEDDDGNPIPRKKKSSSSSTVTKAPPAETAVAEPDGCESRAKAPATNKKKKNHPLLSNFGVLCVAILVALLSSCVTFYVTRNIYSAEHLFSGDL